MKLTFKDLLDVYFAPEAKWWNYTAGKPWWHVKAHRLWLLYKGKQYVARRNRILFNLQRKRSKRWTKKVFLEEMKKPSWLERVGFPKDDNWCGSVMIAPLNPGVKVDKSVGASNKGN